ncbi:hypothetical protein D3C72_2021220 [compost metagenome]
MGVLDHPCLVIAEILLAELVQLLLGGLAAERGKFLGQGRIGADIGFVEQLIVPRNGSDAHRAHGIGDLRRYVGNLRLRRRCRVHRRTPFISRIHDPFQ